MSRPSIPQRTRVFVGCEGESEQGYSRFVAAVTVDRGKPFAIDSHILKGGDPLSRIESAVKIIAQEMDKRGKYEFKFVFQDADQSGLDADRDRQAADLARKHDILMIWQEPDHEGFVLLHFDHTERRHPTTKAQSMAAVKKVWSSYEKASTAKQYASKLGLADLARAGQRHAGLNELLTALKLVERPQAKAEKPAAIERPLRLIQLGGDESA